MSDSQMESAAATAAKDVLIPPVSTSVRRRQSFAQGDMVKYRRSFDLFDIEKNGRVSTSKLPDIIQKLGYRLSGEKLQEILEKYGLSEGSTVSFEQFIEIIPRNDITISEEEHQMADLREKFQRYDIDGNGEISLQEAQWALQVELKVTPQTALRLLNQFIRLDYNQFVDFYRQIQAKKLELYEKFGRYDTDRDGLISGSEAHSVLHKELGFSESRSMAMVKRFDLNHDGNVSYMEFAEFYIAIEEKKEKIRRAFRHFDKEAVGFVTYDQAIEILRNLLGIPEDRCRTVTETYDRNKDGKIDYEEFVEFYSMLEEERQRLLDEFEACDTDNDGLISFDEFKIMMTSKGYSEKEIKTLMTGYDVNKDGYLDLDEFKAFLSFAC